MNLSLLWPASGTLSLGQNFLDIELGHDTYSSSMGLALNQFGLLMGPFKDRYRQWFLFQADFFASCNHGTRACVSPGFSSIRTEHLRWPRVYR